MYRKVLVPLDGSDRAECTLGEVKALVKGGFAGELTLLNVVKIDIPWAQAKTELDAGTLDINALRDQVYATARNYLTTVASRLAAEGVRVQTDFVESHRPAEAIVTYAREQGMDLIIVATHGYTGFQKALLGSVASGVLNTSPVPVLLIRPEACRL